MDRILRNMSGRRPRRAGAPDALHENLLEVLLHRDAGEDRALLAQKACHPAVRLFAVLRPEHEEGPLRVSGLRRNSLRPSPFAPPPRSGFGGGGGRELESPGGGIGQGRRETRCPPATSRPIVRRGE